MYIIMVSNQHDSVSYTKGMSLLKVLNLHRILFYCYLYIIAIDRMWTGKKRMN